MTDAEYHAHPAWSSSKLKSAITGTMLDYWAKHVNPDRWPFEPTDPMRQGSVLDTVLTQPDQFDSRYLVAPACDRRTKDGKAIWAEAIKKAVAQESELIPMDWLINAQAIAHLLRGDSAVKEMLENPGNSQEPHFWVDASGRECRYKPDIEPGDDLIDIKKARSAEPRQFVRQAYAMGYDLQLAHYRLGYIDRYGKPPARVGFMAVEWDAPHNYSLVWLDDAFIAEGERRRELAFQRIAECEATGVWPSHGEYTAKPPGWITGESNRPEPLDQPEIELF